MELWNWTVYKECLFHGLNYIGTVGKGINVGLYSTYFGSSTPPRKQMVPLPIKTEVLSGLYMDGLAKDSLAHAHPSLPQPPPHGTLQTRQATATHVRHAKRRNAAT